MWPTLVGKSAPGNQATSKCTVGVLMCLGISSCPCRPHSRLVPSLFLKSIFVPKFCIKNSEFSVFFRSTSHRSTRDVTWPRSSPTCFRKPARMISHCSSRCRMALVANVAYIGKLLRASQSRSIRDSDHALAYTTLSVASSGCHVHSVRLIWSRVSPPPHVGHINDKYPFHFYI